MIAVDITLKGGLCNKLFQLFSACDIAIKDKTKILEPSFGIQSRNQHAEPNRGTKFWHHSWAPNPGTKSRNQILEPNLGTNFWNQIVTNQTVNIKLDEK